jgi:3'-5' exoribonuclease
MFAELRSWIATVTNPHLRNLLEAIFAEEDIARAYRTAPAAKSVHHAWIGGLIEHVLSLCHLAKFTAAHYTDIDYDLLLAGVILHDLGKIQELSYTRSFSYSTTGQLLGHIVIGVQMIEEKLRLAPDFPAPLRHLLLHMILSHHGELEYGSPKVPMFAEAMLLHQLDTLDSKMECMRSLVERDRSVSGIWTAYSAPLERSVLKKRKLMEPEPLPQAAAPAAAPSPAPSRRQEPSSGFGSKLQDALRRDA